MYVVNGFLKKKILKLKTNWWYISMSLYVLCWQTSTVGFGPVLKESVTGLEECPGGEEQWREAAKRKDCANFAYNLSKPEEFLYHCVINSYLNQTVELCAKEILVFLGNLILYLHFHFFIFFSFINNTSASKLSCTSLSFSSLISSWALFCLHGHVHYWEIKTDYLTLCN